jgi:hypothetical protein
MKKFLAVYNMKSSNFFTPEILSVEEFLNSDDFVSVGYVDAENIDDVYQILNINIPREISVFVHKLAESSFFYESLHTSLSVGDVVVEYTPEGKVYHMCDRCGWVVLK